MPNPGALSAYGLGRSWAYFRKPIPGFPLSSYLGIAKHPPSVRQEDIPPPCAWGKTSVEEGMEKASETSETSAKQSYGWAFARGDGVAIPSFRGAGEGAPAVLGVGPLLKPKRGGIPASMAERVAPSGQGMRIAVRQALHPLIPSAGIPRSLPRRGNWPLVSHPLY
jgi:hypothetical protein